MTTPIEGRERYPVNVRYYAGLPQRPGPPGPRAGAGHGRARRRSRWRSSPTLKLASGPAMLRDENGMLSGYVYVDVAGRDVGSYVAEAKRAGARPGAACRRATRSPGAASTRPWSGCASG